MRIEDFATPHDYVAAMELDKAFRELLDLPAGQRFLFWLLGECGVYQDAFMGDVAATNYRLGLQAMGRKLIAKMEEIDPRAYPDLLLAMARLREIDNSAAVGLADNNEGDDEDL